MNIEIIDFYRLYEFINNNCGKEEIKDFVSLVTKKETISIKVKENTWNVKEIYEQVLEAMGTPKDFKNNNLTDFSNYTPMISLLEKVLLNNEWQTSNLIITIMMNLCDEKTKEQIFNNKVVGSWINKNENLCAKRLETFSIEIQ